MDFCNRGPDTQTKRALVIRNEGNAPIDVASVRIVDDARGAFGLAAASRSVQADHVGFHVAVGERVGVRLREHDGKVRIVVGG